MGVNIGELAMLWQILIYAGMFCIGVLAFAFVNDCIMRIPAGEKVFQGKCSLFMKHTSKRQWVVEILGGVIMIVVLLQYQLSFAALTMYLLYAVLTIITCIDWDTQEIPPQLNVAILVLGVISIFTIGQIGIVERIIGMLCISVPLYLIILVIPDGFGGGDIKMMFAAGFFLGWRATLVAFFIGLVLGGSYGVYLLAARKMGRKEHFAFGPFLAIGIAVSSYAGLGIYLMNLYLEPMKQLLNAS